MRILFLTHAFNSLTQRLFVDLTAAGHDVTIEFDIADSVTIEAVAAARPDLIVAPFLKRAIPEAVWRHHLCLVVHPGPEGDRGPSALDWAILEGAASWGVTVVQAEAEMDAGPVWASRTFPLRAATKGSVYRNEVADAAVSAVLEAVARVQAGLGGRAAAGPDRWRPLCRQADRAIDWAVDDTATVLRKIRSADGMPGLLDRLGDRAVYLFDAHVADGLSGPPGALVARSGGAVARATADGAVWLGHLRWKDGDHPLKLPATMVVDAAALPEAVGPADIWYDERDGVGTLHFPFYNGAMSVDQCRRLLAAYRAAAQRPTRVIVLAGGPDYWSNGIHLNVIEAADSPADASWATINAIDDLAREIITTESHLTVAALHGNAGAGGVFLALAADLVFCRAAVVLNPHYKGMGNLYGSEYWTYLLPRRAGAAAAQAVTEARLPVGAAEACRLGLVDAAFGDTLAGFRAEVDARAQALAHAADFDERLARKRETRHADEAAKPLEAYRAEELARMQLNFYGFDPSYHVARYNFVHKIPKSRTPLFLASHRRRPVAVEDPR